MGKNVLCLFFSYRLSSSRAALFLVPRRLRTASIDERRQLGWKTKIWPAAKRNLIIACYPMILPLAGANAQSESSPSYVGKVLNIAILDAVQQLNNIVLGATTVPDTTMSIKVTPEGGTYTFQSADQQNTSNTPTEVESWNWGDLDPTNVTVTYDETATPGPYTVTANTKTGLDDVKLAIAALNSPGASSQAQLQTYNTLTIQNSSGQTEADQIADLVATLITLAENTPASKQELASQRRLDVVKCSAFMGILNTLAASHGEDLDNLPVWQKLDAGTTGTISAMEELGAELQTKMDPVVLAQVDQTSQSLFQGQTTTDGATYIEKCVANYNFLVANEQ